VASSHCLYLCTRLVSGDGCVRVAGKLVLPLRERLGYRRVGGCGGWGVGGVFMAVGDLAGHQRFCSGIWNVHCLGGCF
jgi:hypothetical protein